MLRAVAGNAAGKNLSPFRDKGLQPLYIFIIDCPDFVHAESAEFLSGG